MNLNILLIKPFRVSFKDIVKQLKEFLHVTHLLWLTNMIRIKISVKVTFLVTLNYLLIETLNEKTEKSLYTTKLKKKYQPNILLSEIKLTSINLLAISIARLYKCIEFLFLFYRT